MSIEWPSGLPQKPNRDDYTETPPNVVLRTETDIGPAKLRKRYTAAPVMFTLSVDCTPSEVEAFDTFFYTTTSYGVLSFDWDHPRTGDPATMRFVSMPRYTPLEHLMRISFSVEILP